MGAVSSVRGGAILAMIWVVADILHYLQVIVMSDYVLTSEGKESSATLLFFRALCDLGVACRFIFYQSINNQVCHDKNCYVDGMQIFSCAFILLRLLIHVFFFICLCRINWK